MSSNALLGDRRWASSRKGMTVLGKVPKPINLPSQRLENHGLDPNVEIVPKGTLTWGNRPAAANAWGSSAHSSPSADGSVGSPTCHNGRPSSGGSGTRPSTAGSDRCSEPPINAWVSNSRPSSASGALASTHAALAATRPRSAETRPGSSQLSRFAESIPENSISWGSSSASGHLISTSKKSDFTLSSGDFPTLGAATNPEPHDQQASHGTLGHPSNSMVSTEREQLNSLKGGGAGVQLVDNANAWKVGSHNSGSLSGNMNSWHADLQSNQLPPNTNMPQHHFNWHGPQRPPDGIWYGGMPQPGPYAPGVAPPGNYMSDPFAYYSSQLAARPNPNIGSSPRPEALLGGYPQKTGEPYCPPMTSDPYMVASIPVIPIRPGMYPGSMPCDGFFGPPNSNFSTSGERGGPIMGMTAAPGSYNQFSNHNVVNIMIRDARNMSAHHDVSVPVVNEQGEGFHSQDKQGRKFRVLLKNHDGSSGGSPGNSMEQLSYTSLQSASNKELSTWEDDAGTDDANIVDFTRSLSKSKSTSSPGSSSVDLIQVSHSKDSSGPGKGEAGSNCQTKIGELTIPPSDVQHIAKKTALLEKIEGLNSKARVTDGRADSVASSKDERTKRSKGENTNALNTTKNVHSMAKSPNENELIGARCTPNDSQENAPRKTFSGYGGDIKTSSQSATTVVSVPDDSKTNPDISSDGNLSVHTHVKSSHHSKSRINESEGRRIQSSGTGVSIDMPDNIEEVGLQYGRPINDCHDKHSLPFVNKARDEIPMAESAEYNAQRAKMKELASQRAKQLLKEEEERNREQKARALAKLEELNKRKLAETSVLKDDSAGLHGDALPSIQEPKVMNAQKADAIGTASVHHAPGSMPKSINVTNCSVRNLVPKQSASSEKLGGSVVQVQVLGKRPEGAMVSQKIDFGNSNNQINFGTIQTCNSGIKNDVGLTMVHTCDSGSEKTKEMTECPNMGLQTSRSASGKLVSPLTSEVGNETLAPLTSEVGNETFSPKSDNVARDIPKQRQVGQRRNVVLHGKNYKEMAVNPSDAAKSEDPMDHEAGSVSSGINFGHGFNEPGGSTVQHKKKNNRSMRNRNRPEHGQLLSSTSHVQNEDILEKPPETCKLDTGTQTDTLSAPSQFNGENIGGQGSKEEIVPANTGWVCTAEEGQAKSSQWKHHAHRRNAQTRPSDKFRGSELVIWAPVKSSSKGELPDGDQTAKKQDLSFKSGADLQNNLKFKRSETERYVPKFVSKDLSQQDPQKPCLSMNDPSEAASETCGNKSNNGNDDGQLPAVSKSEVSLELHVSVTSQPIKHGRGHASWRQRSSHGPSDAIKVASKPSYPELTPNTRISPSKSTTHLIDDHKDSNNKIPVPLSEPAIPAMKDRGVLNRGKRQAHKIQKYSDANSSMINDKDSSNVAADKLKMHTSSIGSDSSEGTGLAKPETPSQVERVRSHWKPKSSQPSLISNQHQDNSSKDVSDSSILAQDSTVQIGDLHTINNMESKHAMKQRTSSADARNLQHYQARKERKPVTVPSEDQSDMSNKDPLITADQDPKSQSGIMHPTAGLHQQGQQRMRFRKGQETGYGGRYYSGHEVDYSGRSSGQGIGHQNAPAGGDRRKQGSHYEYHRVESHKSNDHPQQNAATEDNMQYGVSSRVSGPRYREQVQFHSNRSDQFYTRNASSTVRASETT